MIRHGSDGHHMNAVEIEEAISALAEQPFDAGEFPFAFIQAFGNPDAILRRLRSGCPKTQFYLVS
jgi:hypothetical protein